MAVKTLGQIARELGVGEHKIKYAILANGIKPIGRAGQIRPFDDEAVNRIAAIIRSRKGV
jgi:hypothetical protein